MSEHESALSASALTAHLDALLSGLGGRTSLAAQRLSRAGGRGRALRLAPTLSDDADDPSERPSEKRRPSQGASQSAGVSSGSADTIRLRAEERLPAASLAKLPIALEVLRRVDLGQFVLDETMDTANEPRVGGGGLLDLFSPATRLTLGDLCALMLAVSDNTAANYLLDLVGMGEVNETLLRLNLPATRLARHFMDFAARAAHRENETSASDMATLLALLAGNSLPGGKVIRGYLAGQLCFDELLAVLPPEAEVAHMSGDLEGILNDAGILRGPGGACVYAMLTAEQTDVPAARRAVCQAVRLLWDAWCAPED